MRIAIFHIADMDCAAEENMVRMKLQQLPQVKGIEFNLNQRTVKVFHEATETEILKHLEELKLGAKLIGTGQSNDIKIPTEDVNLQRRLLWTVLAINFTFFVLEITFGFIANSMGLVADSLDMLSDAIVYGLSLWAVGAAVGRKRLVARLSGYFQMLLAMLGFAEVARRFIGFEPMPDFRLMIGISALALIANSFTLWLLQKTKSKEAHIRASQIFTSNDIIINLGVILAGIAVMATGSKYPDLIVGAIVFGIVIRGAIRILQIAKSKD